MYMIPGRKNSTEGKCRCRDEVECGRKVLFVALVFFHYLCLGF